MKIVKYDGTNVVELRKKITEIKEEFGKTVEECADEIYVILKGESALALTKEEQKRCQEWWEDLQDKTDVDFVMKVAKIVCSKIQNDCKEAGVTI